jgi:hypothetical protein
MTTFALIVAQLPVSNIFWASKYDDTGISGRAGIVLAAVYPSRLYGFAPVDSS